MVIAGDFFILNCVELFDFKNYEYIELNKNKDYRINLNHYRFLLALCPRFQFNVILNAMV